MSTITEPSPDPVSERSPEDAAARERRRTRRVIVVSATLTVLVMAAVVVLGWQGRHGTAGEADDSAHVKGPGDPGWKPGEPSWPTPDDGCPVDSEHPPRMVFDLPPSGLDFGSQKQGLVVEREVVFRNEGSGVLCIRRVDSGCGCIKAKLIGDERRYEPGEEGRIRIVLDTKSREGRQKKTITIYTNAVDVPLQRFTVRATVDLGLRFSPGLLRFGRLTAGRSATAQLKVRAPKAEGDDWTISSVQGTRPIDGAPVKYTWRVKQIEDPRDRLLEVTIRHPGLSQPGLVFDDTLVVRTTHPDRPEFTVKANMTVVSAIMPSPRRAVLGYVPNDIPARIRLRPGDADVRFDVTKLTLQRTDGQRLDPGTSGFAASHGRDENGEVWVEIRYDGRENRPPGPLRADLVVHTDLERMPEVKIECFATVKGR